MQLIGNYIHLLGQCNEKDTLFYFFCLIVCGKYEAFKKGPKMCFFPSFMSVVRGSFWRDCFLIDDKSAAQSIKNENQYVLQTCFLQKMTRTGKNGQFRQKVQ